MGRKRRLKERSLASKLRRTLMSKVVYRGVEYDTQKRLEYQQQMMQQPQQYNETYRGVKFVKEGHK
jgi:tagatose-1,6-bisphosphate aldolase non-catalytic subunit AgaZ/GatZ